MASEDRCPAMAALRDETREEHNSAEHHAFQRALFKGEIEQAEYARFLGQMLIVHEALEKAIDANKAGHEAFSKVVHDHQHQSPYAREDLTFLGVDPATIDPGPGAKKAVEAIEKTSKEGDVITLLGMHYVLEGSNNGSKYIAMNVAKRFGWKPGSPGLRYLDPYGDKQQAHWQAFKDDMATVEFSEADIARLVEAAKRMYTIVSDVSDDLQKQPA